MLDYIIIGLLILTIILLALGLLMLGSASSLKAYVKIGDSFYYLKKQNEHQNLLSLNNEYL